VDEFVVDDAIDEVAAFRVKGLARDAECVGPLRGGHGDNDVGIGEQVATRIVDGNDALADIAGAVGDDSGGGDADMSVPGLCGLCVPGDFDGLTDGEFADLGLVEVGVNLDLVEVGDIDEIFTRRNEVVGGDGDGVDSAGLWRSNIETGVGAFGGGDGSPGIGDLRLDAGFIGWAVTLRGARLKALQGAVGSLQTLFGGGDFARVAGVRRDPWSPAAAATGRARDRRLA